MTSSMTMAPARMMSTRSALRPADLPALSLGETLESLADGRDVGLVEPQPVAARALAMGARRWMLASVRTVPPETHHDLATRGGRQADHELRADLRGEAL